MASVTWTSSDGTNVTLNLPDPLPQPQDVGAAQVATDWISVANSALNRSLTTDEKVSISRLALAQYGYQSNAGTTLGSADTTLTTGGDTVTGGDWSWLDDLHENAEVIAQERVDQAEQLASTTVSAVADGTKAVAQWAGEVIAAPLKGLANGIFDAKTLIVLGGVAAVGLVGLYYTSKIVEKVPV